MDGSSSSVLDVVDCDALLSVCEPALIPTVKSGRDSGCEAAPLMPQDTCTPIGSDGRDQSEKVISRGCDELFDFDALGDM